METLALSIFLLLAYLIFLNSTMLWIGRDANVRGMGGSLLWMLAPFFLGPLGLALYLTLRPRGPVRPCPQCTHDRLELQPDCPHCGAHFTGAEQALASAAG
jgi:hypothetical protein